MFFNYGTAQFSDLTRQIYIRRCLNGQSDFIYEKNVFICTIIYTTVFWGFRILLNLLNIEYRQWVFFVFLIVFLIGIISGLVQLIRKTKNIFVMVICILACFLISVIGVPFSLLMVSSFSSEHTIIKDEYKMVAYVDSFLHTTVRYYDYVNPFFCGKRLRLSEYYGDGTFDPFKEKSLSPQKYTWFDDSGNPISSTR